MAPFDEMFNDTTDYAAIAAMCGKKSCGNSSPFPNKVSLAMAYVPYQEWEDLYDEDMALKAGTLFKQLDKPFLGGCRK